ncbi:MAG: aromatic-ring-hydroxylating dioxygenase subunit beta [Pseudomonadota bacterium]
MMRLSAFYTRYNAVLDDLELDSWPEFFSDDCLYRVTTQENWERDLPLSTMMGDSRGMLEDRVSAIQNSMTYAPRAYRRFQSGLRIIGSKPDALKVKSNFLVVQRCLISNQKSPFVVLRTIR